MEEPDKNKIFFAQTNFRNEKVSFGIKRNDRRKHVYVVGKTGMGKTTLLENMAIQDIRNGEGLGVVDPHGGFAEKMLDYIPEDRIRDVIYFNPADTEWPIAFNIMEDIGKEQRYFVSNGLMGVFKKMWPDVWSARMEYILNNAILALLEYPDSTLLGVNRMLVDKEFRKKVVACVEDPVVKSFWKDEFAKYTDRYAAEATPAIQNKVGQLTSNPLIRNIIGQPKSSFDFRKVMDEKKIVIMNLSKGRMGELNSQLIGAMLVTKIYLAAMSRASSPSVDWPDFYLYVDEFQNFATESFKDILSEARKYKLALILAHQYIQQMDEGVRDAVFGNVGTHIIFRVGGYDAEVLEKEFSPEFTAQDIVNLGFATIYLKLMIDGVASRPFSATTLPPIAPPSKSFKKEIIEFSRKTYCKKKEEVEKEIVLWHEPVKEVSGRAAEEKESEVAPVSPNLYEAKCSICGKKTVVPFQPDKKRPVYCQKHRFYLKEATSSGAREEVFRGKSKAEGVGDDNVKSTTLSLKELRGKTQGFRTKKEKPKPDTVSLRELLSKALEEENKKSTVEEEKEGSKEFGKAEGSSRSGILKPGQSIKLD
jgi:CxxC-x17-CxxC domain-containing protein